MQQVYVESVGLFSVGFFTQRDGDRPYEKKKEDLRRRSLHLSTKVRDE